MADFRQRAYSMVGQSTHLKNNEIGKHFLQEEREQFMIE